MPEFLPAVTLPRRDFLADSGRFAGGVVAVTGLGSVGMQQLLAAEEAAAEKKTFPKGKAESCIYIWLGGGAAHMDTWDPKRKGDGKKVAGSAYDAIPTAIAGEQVCEHLQRSAPLLDRAVLVRSVHHEVIDEHAAAVNRLHTGRPVSGTLVYPSIGSIITHEKGQAPDGSPGYVVIGYPNVTRGPGFLGAKASYIYLTETEHGPSGLRPAPGITDVRQTRREALLGQLRTEFAGRYPDDQAVADYAAVSRASFDLMKSRFSKVFELQHEKSALRERYGGEFGQRCLLARRLVQAGSRFVEVSFNLNFVNGTGWDTHQDGQKNQHILIDQLDQAFSTLLLDLEEHKLLDKTLVVISTEFGRPPEFDFAGGRGHQSKAFSIVLAGGGLKTGQVVGKTDDLAKTIVSRPVSVPDLFATMCCALGINPAKEVYSGDRPVPLTDRGQPLRELFS